MDRLFGLCNEAIAGFYDNSYDIRKQLANWATSTTDKELGEFVDLMLAIEEVLRHGKQ